jgi:hypothetical protein
MRYSKRGAEARFRDFHVNIPFDTWHTEYSRGGEPADFATDFFVQIDPLNDGRSWIEVVKYGPYVRGDWTGRVCGRHLVPEISRQRIPVAPTTKDRQEVLDVVTQVIEQQR